MRGVTLSNIELKLNYDQLLQRLRRFMRTLHVNRVSGFRTSRLTWSQLLPTHSCWPIRVRYFHAAGVLVHCPTLQPGRLSAHLRATPPPNLRLPSRFQALNSHAD